MSCGSQKILVIILKGLKNYALQSFQTQPSQCGSWHSTSGLTILLHTVAMSLEGGRAFSVARVSSSHIGLVAIKRQAKPKRGVLLHCVGKVRGARARYVRKNGGTALPMLRIAV